jgi:DNA-binding GntR family transcriptional regulator
MNDTLEAVGALRASLRVPGLATRVGQHIEKLILDGVLQPGSRLVEETIARELGISRSSLREALFALEQAGLIVREERNTRVIRRLDGDDVRELYQMWAILEGEAVALACGVATPEQHAAIRTVMAALEASSDRAEYHRLNLEFHRTLVAPCPNRRLLDAYRLCLKQVHWVWALAISRAGDPDVSRREHREIMEAYFLADGDAVRRLCRAHIAAGDRRADGTTGVRTNPNGTLR